MVACKGGGHSSISDQGRIDVNNLWNGRNQEEFGGGGKYVNGIQVSFSIFIQDVFLTSETQAVP